METTTIALIVFIVLIALIVYIGYAVTLAIGEYDNKDDSIVWITAVASGILYAMAAGISLGGGYHTIGAVMMGISLACDYLLGWIVKDNVVVSGSSGGFTGIRYTALVTKTFFLAMMAYFAGAEASIQGKFDSGSFGSRYLRDKDQSMSSFASSRRQDVFSRPSRQGQTPTGRPRDPSRF